MNNEDSPSSAQEKDMPQSQHDENTPIAQKSTKTQTRNAQDEDGKPHLSGQRPRRKGSLIMEQQFARYHAYHRLHPEAPTVHTELLPSERARLYFFYGSLMDSKHLASVLGLKDEPTLRPAFLDGFGSMLWGPFPAMIPNPDSVLHGVAYQIRSHGEVEEQVAKLEYYEGDNYYRRPVYVQFEDGSPAGGWAFAWQGDTKELRGGVFDLNAWRAEVYGGHST
ncbi:MAG: hypothetical protein Q9208_006821 [Pyrenodesmia sp. 3 TL-2023]